MPSQSGWVSCCRSAVRFGIGENHCSLSEGEPQCGQAVDGEMLQVPILLLHRNF